MSHCHPFKHPDCPNARDGATERPNEQQASSYGKLNRGSSWPAYALRNSVWCGAFVSTVIWAALTAHGCTGKSPQRSTAGESCQTRQDCDSGLACYRQTCVTEGLGIAATGRECLVVECAENADCCDDFVPDANCDFYQATCDADPSQCLSFLTLCMCNAVCDDELCIASTPSCITDEHCAFSSEPFCVADECVQCREQGDCQTNEACADGRCIPPCKANEGCPFMHACEAGACVPRGCESDRECAFLLTDSRAACIDGACGITCSSDFECNVNALEVCAGGRCVFAGCETNEECRIALGLANDGSGARAECR